MFRLLTVVGARPQFIKAAVVSRTIERLRKQGATRVFEQIVHTGQHFDESMSQAFFDELSIPSPLANLGVRGNLHGESTGAMLAGLESQMLAHKPNLVLVYGDTNSTLAAALAAAKLNIPLAHVEAGLRSFNRRMPEEINRVLTDRLSDILFCPSENAKANLAAEGIGQGVYVVGDVMYDAILFFRARAVCPDIDHPYAVATIHRAENTDDPARLRAISEALAMCPVPVILPLHPRTKKAFESAGLTLPGNIRIRPPYSYLEMIGLVAHARFVMTDSGGLQKEAYFLGKRCITLRDETEWTELLDIGANKVVGTDPVAIRRAMDWADAPLEQSELCYGDGNSAIRIIQTIEAHIGD